MIDKNALEEYIKENSGGWDSPEANSSGIFGKNPFGFAGALAGRKKGVPQATGISLRKHPDFAKMEARLKERNENFIDRLIYYIGLKSKTHPEIYRDAGMTPDCFSKILSGKTKRPTKENVVALGIALQLNLSEMNDLLAKAGYAFTGFKVDIIYKFCFETGPHTLDELNEALVDYGFDPIGGRK